MGINANKNVKDSPFLKLSERSKLGLTSGNITGENKTQETQDVKRQERIANLQLFGSDEGQQVQEDEQQIGQVKEKSCDDYFQENEQGEMSFDNTSFWDDSCGVNFGNSNTTNPISGSSSNGSGGDVNSLQSELKLMMRSPENNQTQIKQLKEQIEAAGGSADDIISDGLTKAKQNNQNLTVNEETFGVTTKAGASADETGSTKAAASNETVTKAGATSNTSQTTATKTTSETQTDETSTKASSSASDTSTKVSSTGSSTVNASTTSDSAAELTAALKNYGKVTIVSGRGKTTSTTSTTSSTSTTSTTSFWQTCVNTVTNLPSTIISGMGSAVGSKFIEGTGVGTLASNVSEGLIQNPAKALGSTVGLCDNPYSKKSGDGNTVKEGDVDKAQTTDQAKQVQKTAQKEVSTADKAEKTASNEATQATKEKAAQMSEKETKNAEAAESETTEELQNKEADAQNTKEAQSTETANTKQTNADQLGTEISSLESELGTLTGDDTNTLSRKADVQAQIAEKKAEQAKLLEEKAVAEADAEKAKQLSEQATEKATQAQDMAEKAKVSAEQASEKAAEAGTEFTQQQTIRDKAIKASGVAKGVEKHAAEKIQLLESNMTYGADANGNYGIQSDVDARSVMTSGGASTFDARTSKKK